MAEIPLMALYWTTSGPVEIHAGREWSLFSWRDRCAEAAKVGFEGIGLWHADRRDRGRVFTDVSSTGTVPSGACRGEQVTVSRPGSAAPRPPPRCARGAAPRCTDGALRGG